MLQTCIRYGDRATACQFCAIGQSLAAGRTIARKTPQQLAEVAEAAVRLDGVKHMVMTTGTPATADRGARVLAECAAAITARVDLPIQAQCEPPDDPAWFSRLKAAGVVSLGHAPRGGDRAGPRAHHAGQGRGPRRVLSRCVRDRRSASSVAGRSARTSSRASATAARTSSPYAASSSPSASIPFVVPFVPIRGTPLESHPPPAPAFMQDLLAEVGALVRAGGLTRETLRAGCGRCGACSTLKVHESAA